MVQTYLPVSTAQEGGLFLIAHGRPVWPAHTSEALRGLTEITAIFGAQVKAVEARPGTASGGKEVVVGLGPGVEEATRLYAHLTARRFRLVSKASEVVGSAYPSIIVTKTSRLDRELFEVAVTPGPGGSLAGIICANSADELLQQALLRSAAASLSAEAAMPRIDLCPIMPLPRMVSAGREFLGGKATASEVSDALRKGAGVLNVNTHGDGVDAFLGPQLTLCPMDRPPAGADEKRAPRCRQTGVCHRLHLPVEEALGSGGCVPPEVVSARILVWSVCSGVLLPGGVLDPAWGFIQRLLQSHTIGAIITTWGVIIPDYTALDSLAHDLAGAVPVGKALARFNRSPAVRQLGYRMCLFGDPRVRATAKAQGRALRTQHVPLAIKPRPGVNKALAEVPFLRACLSAQRQRPAGSDSSSGSTTTEAALASLDDYEQAAWAGLPVEGTAGSYGPLMRRNIIKHLFEQRGRLFDDWLRLAVSVKASSKPLACFICGSRTNTLIARMRSPGVARRRLTICPRCGIIEDAPIHAHITLGLERQGAAVRLSGQLPSVHWTAGVYLASTSPVYSVWYDWPCEPDGRPSAVFAPPEPWPPGPLRIGVTMMWDSFLAIVSLPGRGCTADAARRRLAAPEGFATGPL